MSAAPPDHPLLAFYRGTGTDGGGRTIDEVLQLTDEQLEFHHDFIQWLFPLRARSGAVPQAPVFTDAVLAEFRRDPAIRRRMRRALERMLGFYGFELAVTDGAVAVRRGAGFDARCADWCRPRNHNALRLTRILTSLSQVHAAPLARALLEALEAVARERPGQVEARTLEFWRQAVPP